MTGEKPTVCPWCGAALANLFIAWAFVAKPIGTWSLAGMQPKANATQVPVLVCRACRKEVHGTVNDGFCFPPDAEPVPLTDAQLAAREADLLREAAPQPEQ